MKIILSIFALILSLSFFELVSAGGSYDWFKTNDGRYFCSTFFIDDTFQECSEFGFTDEDFLEGFFSDGFHISSDLVTVGDESFCIKDSTQIELSACKKITRFMNNLEGGFTCIIRDGKMTNCFHSSYSEETGRNTPLIGLVVNINGEKSAPINTETESVGPSKSQKASGYFTRDDGSIYCIQWDRTQPLEQQFYYTLCSEIGFESFSGQYLISTDGTEYLTNYQYNKKWADDDVSANWLYFGKTGKMICVNEMGVESKDCKIFYIKGYDNEYLCSLKSDLQYVPLVSCSLFSEFIGIGDGVPSSKGVYAVESLESGRKFWKDEKDIYREVNYDKGVEVQDSLIEFNRHPTRINAQNISKISADNSDDMRNNSMPLNYSSSGTGCTLNGQATDCIEIASGVQSIMKAGFGTLGIFILLSLVFGIFWIWMLVHALGNPIPNKILWIVAIFFLSPLVAIIYYFFIKQKHTTILVPNLNAQLYQSNIQTTPPVITIVQAIPEIPSSTLPSLAPISPATPVIPTLVIPDAIPVVISSVEVATSSQIPPVSSMPVIPMHAQDISVTPIISDEPPVASTPGLSSTTSVISQ